MGDFYKMDPSAWDIGTTELSLEEEAAYLRIVNATHKHRAAVPANDRVLSGMFRCSTRKARSLLDALVAAGKVRVEGGLIVNDRAISDLVHRGFVSSSRAESGAKGGRVRAERAAKALETKDEPQAIASSREEKRREEKIQEAGASCIGARKRARKPEIPIPENWTPSDKNLSDAYARQFTDEEIRHEAAQFRDHHTARGTRFRDWDAAWRTWLGNARKFAPRVVAGRSFTGGRGQGGSLASVVARRRLEGGL